MARFQVCSNGEEAAAALSRDVDRADLAVVPDCAGNTILIVQAGKKLKFLRLPRYIRVDRLPDDDVVSKYDIYQIYYVRTNEFTKRLGRPGWYRRILDLLLARKILLRMWRR
ncbi:hypothetical protein C4564_01390 [Candidatus Microgenomates bacterium]|nr:MAG: hypothetical protein C4564_01390 [Candidatus Microgenomates bacterium]